MGYVKDLIDSAETAGATLNEERARFDTTIAPLVEDIHQKVTKETTKEFSEFLYKIMGNGVNSVRKQMLNPAAYAGNEHLRTLVDQATAGGISIEEALKACGTEYDNYTLRRIRDTAAYITTGKEFGLSYFNGADSTYTRYIPAGKLFEYLLPEHAKLVSNKDKRACVQDFVDYKAMYIRDDAAQIRVEPFAHPLATTKIYGLMVREPFKDRYNQAITGFVMDAIQQDLVTHVIVAHKTTDVYTGFGIPQGYVLNNTRNREQALTMLFVNLNTEGVTRIMGNITIGCNKDATCSLKGCIDASGVSTNRHELSYGPDMDKQLTALLPGRKMVMDSFPIGLTDLVNDDIVRIVKGYIDNHLSLYGKLMELKHKYADRYFLYGDM